MKVIVTMVVLSLTSVSAIGSHVQYDYSCTVRDSSNSSLTGVNKELRDGDVLCYPLANGSHTILLENDGGVLHYDLYETLSSPPMASSNSIGSILRIEDPQLGFEFTCLGH